MIINKTGAEYTYGVITYRIGDRVYANDQSSYNGLYGEIIEICTDDDKGSENEGPDISCRFDVPIFPEKRRELEERFSNLYKVPKTIDELGLDNIPMSAEMIDILYEQQTFSYQLPLFFLVTEWVEDGVYDRRQQIVTDIRTARDRFQQVLKEDMEDGTPAKLAELDGFMSKFENDYFECWLENSYFENHYRICIVSQSVSLSPNALSTVADFHTRECYKEDFITHVMQWEETSELSDVQFQRYVTNPSISNLIESKLNDNGHYWEAFWSSVSEVAEDLFALITKEEHT